MAMQTSSPQQSTAIVVSAKERVEKLSKELDARSAMISALLPAHVPLRRFLKITIGAISRTPALLECTPASLVLSVLQCAELGLELGGVLGQAYLVPFKNKSGVKEAQFVPGYRGLITLARNSGQILSIEARAVHEKDVFEVEFGINQKLRHVPYLSGDAGPIVAFYACAHLRGGATHVEVMSLAEVNTIKAGSPAGGSGPWVEHFEQMGRKTLVRRIFKFLPMSTHMARAAAYIDREAGADDAEVPDFSDLTTIETDVVQTEPAPSKGAERIAKKLEAKEAKTTAGAPEAEPVGRQPGED